MTQFYHPLYFIMLVVFGQEISLFDEIQKINFWLRKKAYLMKFRKFEGCKKVFWNFLIEN